MAKVIRKTQGFDGYAKYEAGTLFEYAQSDNDYQPDEYAFLLCRANDEKWFTVCIQTGLLHRHPSKDQASVLEEMTPLIDSVLLENETQ